jgi:hypothetical protein
LGEWQIVAADTVSGLQQPATQTGRRVVCGIARGDLLRFDPKNFGIARNQIAYWRMVQRKLRERSGANDREFAGNLRCRARE